MNYRAWKVNNPKAALLLVYGMGAHNSRWDFLAQFFNSQQYSCYGVELKGYGETKTLPRGHVDSFDEYYNEVRELKKTISAELPGRKIFIFGESMGGLISFYLANEFDGAIFVSPAFRNAMPFSIMDYLRLPLALVFNPKQQFKMPFTAQMCTRDIEYQKIMENHPHEERVASAKLLIEILKAQLGASAKKITVPVLFLIPGKDVMIDEREGKKVFKNLNTQDKTLIEYPEMLHALSIELGREKVFQDTLEWINKRV